MGRGQGTARTTQPAADARLPPAPLVAARADDRRSARRHPRPEAAAIRGRSAHPQRRRPPAHDRGPAPDARRGTPAPTRRHGPRRGGRDVRATDRAHAQPCQGSARRAPEAPCRRDRRAHRAAARDGDRRQGRRRSRSPARSLGRAAAPRCRRRHRALRGACRARRRQPPAAARPLLQGSARRLHPLPRAREAGLDIAGPLGRGRDHLPPRPSHAPPSQARHRSRRGPRRKARCAPPRRPLLRAGPMVAARHRAEGPRSRAARGRPALLRAVPVHPGRERAQIWRPLPAGLGRLWRLSRPARLLGRVPPRCRGLRRAGRHLGRIRRRSSRA